MDNIPIIEAGSPTAAVRARDAGGTPAVKVQRVEVADWEPNALDLAAAGDHQVTVGSTSTLLPNIPSDATHALISVENDSIRWFDTGTTPTSTTGHKLMPDAYFWLAGRQRLLDWKCIRITTDAVLRVTYYKFL